MYPVLRGSVYVKSIVTIAAALILGVTSTEAQSLVITDCQGFTRAVKRTEAGTKNNVEVQVDSAPGTSTAQEITATLTNQITKQAIQSRVTGGVARFEGIDPGVYALELSQENSVVGAISIEGGGVGLLGAGAAIVGAGAVGGGAIVGGVIAVEEIADQIDGNGGGESDLPPTPVPATPTARPTPFRPRPTATPNDCPQCEPDVTPPPIRSPFPPDKLPARTKRASEDTAAPPRAAAKKLSPFD